MYHTCTNNHTQCTEKRKERTNINTQVHVHTYILYIHSMCTVLIYMAGLRSEVQVISTIVCESAVEMSSPNTYHNIHHRPSEQMSHTCTCIQQLTQHSFMYIILCTCSCMQCIYMYIHVHVLGSYTHPVMCAAPC